jgi:GNAT superfamily N-acetyltransferase
METVGTLTIRDAHAGDYQTFLRFVVELRVDDPLPDFARWSSFVLPTMMVAEEAGEALGYVFYRPLDGVMHLVHIAIAPGARRRGVGRALFEETIRRGKAAGADTLFLNVKPENSAAIALYSSFGLTPVSRSWAFRLPWSLVEAHPAPFLSAVRPLDAGEDTAIEKRHGLASGTLKSHRMQTGRVLYAIDPASFTSFDPGFGGAHPFAAESLDHGFSLLRALRPHARPEHEQIMTTIENREEQATAMLAAGATLRFEVQRMSGRI